MVCFTLAPMAGNKRQASAIEGEAYNSAIPDPDSRPPRLEHARFTFPANCLARVRELRDDFIVY